MDGVVVEGASAVSEALVTGEPIPRDKAAGDGVIGGPVNQTGTVLSLRVPMDCSVCAETIRRSLLRMAGVRRASADATSAEVTVAYLADAVSERAIRERLRELGFEVRGRAGGADPLPHAADLGTPPEEGSGTRWGETQR